jgi:hypothetical protein
VAGFLPGLCGKSRADHRLATARLLRGILERGPQKHWRWPVSRENCGLFTTVAPLLHRLYRNSGATVVIAVQAVQVTSRRCPWTLRPDHPLD